MVERNEKGLGKSTVTSVIIGGRRRLNINFEDKTEMIEEYDLQTHELVTRRIKKPMHVKEAQWQYEIGEAPPKDPAEELLRANNKNPVFMRKDTAKDFQFRIRNLPYPEDIETDDEKQQIVVKTTNKKFYKRIDIADLQRKGIKLEKEKVFWAYKNNTLVISYPKPDQILTFEQHIREEFDKLNKKKPKEGDIECVTQ